MHGKKHDQGQSQQRSDIEQAKKDANRDPLSGRAGAHPVGTGVGAAAGGVAAGAAAGAAIGTVAGPVGTAIGAAVGAAAGAVGGGLAGKAIAESVNPTVEHGYWRSKFSSRPYARPGIVYEEYAPAYQFGWESYGRHQGKSFDEIEPTLGQEWTNYRGKSKLEWDSARHAARDAWNRMDVHEEM